MNLVAGTAGDGAVMLPGGVAFPAALAAIPH